MSGQKRLEMSKGGTNESLKGTGYNKRAGAEASKNVHNQPKSRSKGKK